VTNELTNFVARGGHDGTVLDVVEWFIDRCLYMPPHDRMAKALSRDNLDENGATIWMRRGGRAEG
jgi:hypothetical protein